MTKINTSLLKTGVLAVICYLRANREARFSELTSKLGVPAKTIALRLIELGGAGLITRGARRDRAVLMVLLSSSCRFS